MRHSVLPNIREVLIALSCDGHKLLELGMPRTDVSRQSQTDGWTEVKTKKPKKQKTNVGHTKESHDHSDVPRESLEDNRPKITNRQNGHQHRSDKQQKQKNEQSAHN